MCEMLFHFLGYVSKVFFPKVLIYSENFVFQTSIQVEKCRIYFFSSSPAELLGDDLLIKLCAATALITHLFNGAANYVAPV